jgi:hypothetical protein
MNRNTLGIAQGNAFLTERKHSLGIIRCDFSVSIFSSPLISTGRSCVLFLYCGNWYNMAVCNSFSIYHQTRISF